MPDQATLRLTDEGLEAPEHVIGRTGKVTVEKPNVKMQVFFREPATDIEPELLTLPPTGEEHQGYDIPEGHLKIDGLLYEVVDDRDLNECPHCGSDSVAAHDDPPHCYGCDTDLEVVEA